MAHFAAAAGVRALLGLNPGTARVTAGDLAFRAGPRLNAAGRMDDMSLGIECLLCDDPAAAAEMAAPLDALNHERRAVEAQMQAQATARMDALPDPLPAALCLHDADWHPGVIGIVAARLRERYARPAVAFAPADDGRWRGSARSLPGVHIRDALAAVAAGQPGLIEKFGGHAMAAGLTLPGEHLPRFAAALSEAVLAQTGGVLPEDALLSDGPLDPALLTLELAKRLHGAGPWGEVNERYATYARSLRFHVDAARPRTPEDKGKVERRILAHKSGFDPRRRAWRDLAELQVATDAAVTRSAEKRICPATGETVLASHQAEQRLLTALPALLPEPFDLVAQRRVSRESTVSFEGRTYSVPFHLADTVVEVRGCATTVQIVADGDIVAEHARHTRARGALRGTCFLMLSVVVGMEGSVGPGHALVAQPYGCILASPRSLATF